MCGRYYISEKDEDDMLASYLAEVRERADRTGAPLKDHGDIFPTDVAPVIATSSLRREIGAYPMRWGFTHPTRGMLVINTCSETATAKDLFSASVCNRRCLIPASGYYEWRPTGRAKTRYTFRSMDGKPLYLAGLYMRSSQMPIPYFTILTRDAAEDIKDIHARMPLILPWEYANEWLSSERCYADFLENAVLQVRFEAG